MADEARAMLDALMGGDRNAPLPPGGAGSGGEVRALGRKRKSCFDQDICPLYCAWGIDVYELFKNTKSDTLVGINPNVVDDAAHEEFIKLPKQEQERLGYHAMLFRKLQDLVSRCDRTVNRNKEKLKQEMARQLQKRAGKDFVEAVDESAVQQLASSMVRLEFLNADLVELVEKLEQTAQTEREMEIKLEEAMKEEESKKDGENEEDQAEKNEEDTVPMEEDTKTTEPKDEQESSKTQDKTADATVPVEEDSKTAEEEAVEAKPEETNGTSQNETTPKNGEEQTAPPPQKSKQVLQLEKDLTSVVRLEKQRYLVEIRNKLMQHQPLSESVESQRRQLEYVKSDITSDKTVCEVSGNFMSARDADERIAAHYAGKQYVGWKLVRDKRKEMIKEYGRFGPPGGGRGGGGGPPPRDDRGRDRGRNYGYNDRSRDRDGYRGGGGGGGNWRRDRGPGRGYDRGGGGGDWRRDRGPSGGRGWRR